MTAGPGSNGRGAGGSPLFTGGFGAGDVPTNATPTIKGTPLMVDGTLYVSAPDNAWAVDPRDGRVLWHYYWKTRGGTHIGNRGLGMWGNYLFMETPDNYLVDP